VKQNIFYAKNNDNYSLYIFRLIEELYNHR